MLQNNDIYLNHSHLKRWDAVSRINGMNNPGDNMHCERNSQQPPEDCMKSVEPLEDIAGKRVPGTKKADETEKTLA